MKIKLIQWLYNYLQPKYTKKQIGQINKFKSLFRIYFEGYDLTDIPNVAIPINRFEITELLFNFVDNNLIVTIVLCRPGLLIGRYGKTIDGLNKWLKTENMNVELKESKIWRTTQL